MKIESSFNTNPYFDNFSSANISTNIKKSESTSSYYSANTNKSKKSSSTSITKSISANKYLIPIANASTVPRVSAIVRDARAEVRFVKDSGAKKEDIAKALSILKRVIAKGSSKMKNLKHEKQMELQKQFLNSIKDHEREKELHNEINRKRRARKFQEALDTCEDEKVDIRTNSDSPDNNQEICNIYSSVTAYSEPSIDITTDSTVSVTACDTDSAVVDVIV